MYFKTFYLIILLLSFSSFFSWGKANLLPATAIFDGLILLAVLLTKPVFKDRKFAVIFYFLISYIALSFIYSVIFKADHLLDFLLSYKVFFYLAIVTMFFGKNIVTPKHFSTLFKTLLIVFTLKYFVSVVFSLSESRPIVFRENNFELLFIALLFYLQYKIRGYIKPWEWLSIVTVFILSGSKSAIPIFIFVAACVLFQKVTFRKFIVVVPLLLLLCGAFFSLLLSKYGETGLSGIDRLAFLRVFIVEMTESTWTGILLGKERISPLLSSSCQSLYFYQGLFSYNNDGTCYSPILHAYILRVIIDHGIIGMLTVFWITHLLLIKSGYSTKDSFVFNFVLFLNGLSVSGYNSGFYALSMILYMGINRTNIPILTLDHRSKVNLQ